MSGLTSHEILKKYITGLTKGLANSLIVCSPTGYGKTEITFTTLTELGFKENQHYRYLANYITPKALVETLQEINSLENPKILVLDDCEDTLKQLQSVGVLKGALWATPDGQRRVSWITSRENTQFNFEGRIIFLLNYINKKSDVVNAFKDRSLFYEMRLTLADMFQLMSERAKLPYQDIPFNKRKEIIDFLQKVGKNSPNISLRILPKAYNLFLLSPNHWQNLVKELL